MFHKFDAFFVVTSMKRFIVGILLLFCCSAISEAQSLTAKTNVLYWGTTTPNIGLEYSIAPRWSIELECGYNPWTFDKENNIKAKHFLVSPEIRYWFCETFNGHFIGLQANYVMYNVGGIPFPAAFGPSVESESLMLSSLKKSRNEGWAAGAGLLYGYSWPIARRWNIEANLGVGFWYTGYDRYQTRKCGLFQDSVSKTVFGLTSLGLSFVYIIL